MGIEGRRRVGDRCDVVESLRRFAHVYKRLVFDVGPRLVAIATEKRSVQRFDERTWAQDRTKSLPDYIHAAMFVEEKPVHFVFAIERTAH